MSASLGMKVELKLCALLLCGRPQDARVMRAALEARSVVVDHCFDVFTAERLLESQKYGFVIFDLKTEGARELMERVKGGPARGRQSGTRWLLRSAPGKHQRNGKHR